MKKRIKRGRPRGLPALDERHYRAIDLLSDLRRGGRTLDDIAEELGVDRRTLYRRRQRKDFARLLEREVRRKVRERVPRTQAGYDHHNAKTAEYLLRINDML